MFLYRHHVCKDRHITSYITILASDLLSLIITSNNQQQQIALIATYCISVHSPTRGYTLVVSPISSIRQIHILLNHIGLYSE